MDFLLYPTMLSCSPLLFIVHEMKMIILLSYWVCCEGFFFFFLRGLRGIKLLPASTLSPFISSLTQEQRWQQYFWADIKIKGAFLTLQPRQKSIFYSQVKLHSPSYVPQPEQQQRWPVHWESWEAGDHPYLDVPVIMWPENGGESVFPVNCSRREMLRSCKEASFSPSW